MQQAARATFFLSTGRCGTQWFHDTLPKVCGGGAVITHEPLLGDYRPKRHLRNAAGLAEDARFQAHLSEVTRLLDDGRPYIETGWPCDPAVPLFVDRLGNRAGFVHLVRNPVNVALSLATHRVYARDDWIGTGALDPFDPGVVQKDLAARWEGMTDYERTLFWWTEVNLYIEELKRECPDHEFLLVRYEDFFDPLNDEPVQALGRFVGLSDDAALDRHRARNVDRFRYVMPPVDWELIFDYPVTCALAERLGYGTEVLRSAATAGAYEHYNAAAI